jgi:hypothetical protein
MMLWHLLITLLKWRKLLLITTLVCVIYVGFLGAVLGAAEVVPQGGFDAYRNVVVERREATTFLNHIAEGDRLFPTLGPHSCYSGNNCNEELPA